MLSLLLAVISSSLISLLMRFTSDKVEGNLSLLASNYIMCSFLGACFSKFQLAPVEAPGFSFAPGLGMTAGILFLVSFMLLTRNYRNVNGSAYSNCGSTCYVEYLAD